jgi:3-methylfumaryl-CoA hydratase
VSASSSSQLDGDAQVRNWVGRRQTRTDWVTAARVDAWHATLDRDARPADDGDDAPPGFHWTLFPPLSRTADLGDDGHPRTGGLLTPVPLPRRMWAGSRVKFERPLRVGASVEQESTVQAVEEKQGRTGGLIFITMRHLIRDSEGLVIDEEQDLVYRSAAANQTPVDQAPAGVSPGVWIKRVTPNEALLFRYSALTFNGHRIHYDRRYATITEGYPGLVVHGPLIATLMLELVRDRALDAYVERFAFKARRPSFDGNELAVHGEPDDDGHRIRLWSTDHEGNLGMEADAWIR